MANCLLRLLQYLLFFFNFTFVLTGLTIIGLGIYIKSTASSYLDLLAHDVISTPIFLILVGFIVFIVALFGCLGAWKDNSCMIWSYFILLVMIAIAEMTIGIAIIAQKDQVQTQISMGLTKGMVQYSNGSSPVKTTWDFIQTQFLCCGVNNVTDWPTNNVEIPDSCCAPPMIRGTCTKVEAYEGGCFDDLANYIKDHISAIVGTFLGVVIAQLIGAGASFKIGRSMCITQ